MRSEYLGACALIEGLADAINAGMFLTPRMTRDQCHEAITGPAEVCDIDLEPALVNRLLNDLANFAPWDEGDAHDQLDRIMRRADQLPLLQYTLNRMWLRARKPEGTERIRLTIADYDAIGGLSGALNAHANQIFEELGKARWPVVEWVFRALTAGSTIADAVRRPTRFDELVTICGGNEARCAPWSTPSGRPASTSWCRNSIRRIRSCRPTPISTSATRASSGNGRSSPNGSKRRAARRSNGAG